MAEAPPAPTAHVAPIHVWGRAPHWLGGCEPCPSCHQVAPHCRPCPSGWRTLVGGETTRWPHSAGSGAGVGAGAGDVVSTLGRIQVRRWAQFISVCVQGIRRLQLLAATWFRGQPQQCLSGVATPGMAPAPCTSVRHSCHVVL